MATKFSQFNLENNPQNLTTQLVGLDTVAGTNIKVPADLALLDALTDAPNQSNNDILYISGGNVDFINPSQHPNVPVRISLYAEWLNKGGNSYFNIPKSSLTNIPYNDEQSNANTNSVAGSGITMNYNGIPGNNGNTYFTIDTEGQYKVGINLNFFDQSSANSGMSVFAGIYTRNTTNLIKGIVNTVAGNHNKNDMNYFGQNTFTAAAGDEIEIKLEFIGGNGNNPFPATTGGIACSICIEKID